MDYIIKNGSNMDKKPLIIANQKKAFLIFATFVVEKGRETNQL